MFSQLTGLSEAFGNTPNPQFLLPSHSHAAALSFLSGVPKGPRNIRVLIGEPGVGKTILLLRLLEQFRGSALTAHLFWTQLGRGEFLQYFLHELGVLHPRNEIREAQHQLTEVLEREFRHGRKVIVAIDEAQNLEIAAMRELAELLDCNMARAKNLEVVLAGLPQLTGKLAARELRGFWDRISEITSVSPLRADEIASYIHLRLAVSGYHGDNPFTSEAIAAIATLTEGIPRNINNICFAAVFLAARRSCSMIDLSIVLDASAHLEGRAIRQEATQQWIPAPADMLTAQPMDQPTSGPAAQHISAAPTEAPPLPENSEDAAARETAGGDEGTVSLADRIRRWFGSQRVAWSGTLGELAAAVDQPEIEVAHSLHADSEILRSVGIALSVYESFGRTRSVSLRRIEEPEQTTTEGASNEPRPEARVDALPHFEAYNWPAEEPPNDVHPPHVLVEDAPPIFAPAEPASASPADHRLDLLRANSLQQVEVPASASRRAVPARLIVLVAIVIGLSQIHSPLLKRKGYVTRLPQQGTEAKVASNAIIAGKPGAVANNPNSFPWPVSAGVQDLSGSRVLEAKGRAHVAEQTQSFQRAALSGDPNAQFKLGTAYALGRGVPADPVTAYTWLILAFANGDQAAESLIRDLTPKMNQSEIARIRWNLGQMYASGVGVHPDKVTAYMWHLLAESAGERRSSIARSELASSMTADEKSEANARASQWLRRHQK